MAFRQVTVGLTRGKGSTRMSNLLPSKVLLNNAWVCFYGEEERNECERVLF